MTVGILSWNTRNYGLTSLQGWLLVNLYWQTNAHLRCWVGTNKLAKQCDVASATLDKALDWLVKHGAVIKVPFDKRHNEEKKLHQRKTVYQLTGVIKINDEWKRYIEVANPETMYTIATLIGEINFSLAEILRAEFSIAKILTGENEGNKELEGNPESKQGNTRKDNTRATPRKTKTPGKTSPKEKQPRKPNPVFDAVALAIFGIKDSTALNGSASSVGALAKCVKTLFTAQFGEFNEEIAVKTVKNFASTQKVQYIQYKSQFEPKYLAYIQSKDKSIRLALNPQQPTAEPKKPTFERMKYE